MEWNLTSLLALTGAVVLVGVVVHGWWQARRAGPRQAPVLPREQRQEPSLGQGAAEGTQEGDTLPMEFAPGTPGQTLVRKPSKPSVRIDALIDAIATIRPDTLVSAELALAHLPGSWRAGTKPLHIEAINSETGEWELPQPGQRYSEFQAAVQLANRAGALNEIEYSEFVHKVQAFADGINALPEFPDMLDVVARARELDQFAAGHDAQLAIVLRARGAAWTPGFVHQIAARHGFTAGALPGRLVLPSSEEGAPPVLTLSYDAQAAMADEAQNVVVRELTLALDVQQTPEALEPFAAWQEASRGLARDFEADVCDDRGQVLNLHAFQSIGQELSTLYKALASRDLAAGSSAARRLFS
ncbi:cell division protein FtsZ [Roseateles sp. BYS180W]|uniref:Cell division protein FtsZ n=1 Tax=Roseateles rivi TaxID=3299028 RepID=A0ABW7FXX3_9BURK